MTEKEKDELLNILCKPAWDSRLKAIEYVKRLDTGEKQPTKRTPAQSNALHLACQLLADALNDAGLEMRVVLKPEVPIPWTKESVKEHLWKPVMRLKTGKESTTELEKTSGEIGEIWDIIMRFLGEKHGVEYINFPSNNGLPVMYEEANNN